MSFEIVELTAETADLLENIAPDVFDEPVRPEYLSAFLSCPRHKMMLAVENSIVVGMASAVEYFHPDKAPQLWINEVGTATTHRRRGIGTALTEALINFAEARGCTYVWLGTEPDNLAARALYKRAAGGGDETTFIGYEWDLEDD